MKLLIKQGKLVDPVGGIGGIIDILVEDGKVAVIGSHLEEPMARVLDASGLVVSAGLVDMHVHLREPGFAYKEEIATGAAAAARGGFTSIACMPNTKPAIDTPEMVAFVRDRARQGCGVHVWPIASVSKGQMGREMTDARALRDAGAVALSDDGLPVMDANLMRDALMRATRNQLTILSHCEDANMVDGRAVNEGKVSRQLGIPGRPAIAEELMVARDAMLAEETGTAVHICHVSTARSVDLIRRYKKKGVAITCETCPQYFTLTEDEVVKQGTLAKVNPPLRTSADVDAIIAGLKDGTIDAIATDHAPHSEEEKARPLTEAPSGMVGLETALGLTLTQLYHTGRMSLSDIVRKMTINPANILRIPKGRLALGADADILIFDPDERWTVKPEEFASKGRNTPFGGVRLRGKVKYTIIGGEIVYQDKA
ncbi:MAG: dihydroorotase [Oscillospiraceae bacterium]|nr:dihydroorotase [Oscillospiraceae bacterium]